ncbi:MAG: hypothetical protein Q8L95_06930 [Burkholderiales bacterium]|nr:hypothetical protein [Burkholderiales bacterium]
MPSLQIIRLRAQRTYQFVSGLTRREKQHLLEQLQQTRGVMPILMKQRNGQHWSAEDRALLRAHFDRLSRLSPYLVLIVMPGGFLMLPVFAWWLDRRRLRHSQARPPAL